MRVEENMMRTMYIVGALKESLIIEIHPDGPGYPIACTWAYGMIGAFPAFYDLEAAQAYAGDKYEILEFTVNVPERQ